MIYSTYLIIQRQYVNTDSPHYLHSSHGKTGVIPQICQPILACFDMALYWCWCSVCFPWRNIFNSITTGDDVYFLKSITNYWDLSGVFLQCDSHYDVYLAFGKIITSDILVQRCWICRFRNICYTCIVSCKLCQKYRVIKHVLYLLVKNVSFSIEKGATTS